MIPQSPSGLASNMPNINSRPPDLPNNTATSPAASPVSLPSALKQAPPQTHSSQKPKQPQTSPSASRAYASFPSITANKITVCSSPPPSSADTTLQPHSLPNAAAASAAPDSASNPDSTNGTDSAAFRSNTSSTSLDSMNSSASSNSTLKIAAAAKSQQQKLKPFRSNSSSSSASNIRHQLDVASSPITSTSTTGHSGNGNAAAPGSSISSTSVKNSEKALQATASASASASASTSAGASASTDTPLNNSSTISANTSANTTVSGPSSFLKTSAASLGIASYPSLKNGGIKPSLSSGLSSQPGSISSIMSSKNWISSQKPADLSTLPFTSNSPKVETASPANTSTITPATTTMPKPTTPNIKPAIMAKPPFHAASLASSDFAAYKNLAMSSNLLNIKPTTLGPSNIQTKATGGPKILPNIMPNKKISPAVTAATSNVTATHNISPKPTLSSKVATPTQNSNPSRILPNTLDQNGHSHHNIYNNNISPAANGAASIQSATTILDNTKKNLANNDNDTVNNGGIAMQRSSSSNMSVMSYGKESSSELQSILSSKVKENEKLRIIIEKLRNEINLLKILQDSKNQAANNTIANTTATTTKNNTSNSNNNNNSSFYNIQASGRSSVNSISRPASQQQQQKDVTVKTVDNNTLIEMETINPMKLSNNLAAELPSAESNGNLFNAASDAKPPKGGKTNAKSKTGKNTTANGTSKKKKEGRANKRQHLSNDADPAFRAAATSSNTSFANANSKNMPSAAPAVSAGNGQRSSISHSMLNLSLIENGRPDGGIAAAASGIVSSAFVGTNSMADDEEFGILDDRLSSSPSPSLSLTMSNSSEITELDVDSSLLMGSLQSLSPISTNSNSPNFNGGDNGTHSEYHDTLLRTALANDTEQQYQQHNGKVSHYLNNNTHHHDPNTLKRLLSNNSVKLERSRSLNSYNGYSNSYNDGSATSHLNSVLRVSQMNLGSSSAAAAAAAAVSNAGLLSNNEDSDSPAVAGATLPTKTGAGKKSSKVSKSNSSSATAGAGAGASAGAGAATKPKGKTRGRKPKNATAAALSSKISSIDNGVADASNTAANIANSTGIAGELDMTKVNISNVEKFLDYDPVSDANGLGMDSDLEEAYLRFVRLDDEFSKEFANGGNGDGINDEDDFLTRFYDIDNSSLINDHNINGNYTKSDLENPSVAELKSLKLERSLSVPTYSEPKKTKKPSSARSRPIKRPTKHFTSDRANSSKPQAKSNISSTKTGGSGKASQMNLNSPKGNGAADGSATIDADKESKSQLVPNFEACGFCVDGAPCLCIEAAMELAEANKLTSSASSANDSANNNSSSSLVSEVTNNRNINGNSNGNGKSKSKGKRKGKGNGVKIEVDNDTTINAVDDIASSAASMDIDTFGNNTIGQNDNNNNSTNGESDRIGNGNDNGSESGVQGAKVKIEIEEQKVATATGIGANDSFGSKGDVDGDVDMSWFIKQEAE